MANVSICDKHSLTSYNVSVLWSGILLVSEASSEYSCVYTFHGPYPASEIETRALMEFLLSRNDHIKAYFTLHNYGQGVATRWGYSTEEHPDDDEELVS